MADIPEERLLRILLSLDSALGEYRKAVRSKTSYKRLHTQITHCLRWLNANIEADSLRESIRKANLQYEDVLLNLLSEPIFREFH